MKNIAEYYQYTGERVDGGGVVTGQRLTDGERVYIVDFQPSSFMLQSSDKTYPYKYLRIPDYHEVRPETVERVAVKVKNLTPSHHWKQKDEVEYYIGGCPNCGETVCSLRKTPIRIPKTSFCPCCGMRLDWS